MQYYNFGTSITLRPLELQRRESEREAEEYRSDFSHHANPLRSFDDVMDVRCTVRAPEMTEDQQKAFIGAMNAALRRFEEDFRFRLEKATHGD